MALVRIFHFYDDGITNTFETFIPVPSKGPTLIRVDITDLYIIEELRKKEEETGERGTEGLAPHDFH